MASDCDRPPGPTAPGCSISGGFRRVSTRYQASVDTSLEPSLQDTLRSLTAFDSLEQLQAHVANGGKPPSFRADKADGVELANALLPHGIRCTIWS